MASSLSTARAHRGSAPSPAASAGAASSGDSASAFRCWICLTDETDLDEAGMIAPCACVGTNQWVHEDCAPPRAREPTHTHVGRVPSVTACMRTLSPTHRRCASSSLLFFVCVVWHRSCSSSPARAHLLLGRPQDLLLATPGDARRVVADAARRVSHLPHRLPDHRDARLRGGRVGRLA